MTVSVILKPAGKEGARLRKPATATACWTVSLVGLFSAACSPGPAPTESLEETIVYSTIRPANWDLYLFNEPGATPRQLTTDPSPDYNPAFSPDGRWVVFTSDRHGTADLFALDLNDPGEPVRLSSSNAMEDAAAFSPDGRSLAFVSTESRHLHHAVHAGRAGRGNPGCQPHAG